MSMLSRVAENIFWVGRYIERAENMARLLDTGRRMAAVPGPDGVRNEWESVLRSSGADFCYPTDVSPNSHRDVIAHLGMSTDNPSSIYSSIQMARSNARSTREGLSSDLWRALNDLWLSLNGELGAAGREGYLADFIEGVKFGCMAITGAADSTVLRNETYDFLRLGTFVERADSTARILDVKYFSLLPPDEEIEGGVDSYQWMTILDATSTRRMFRRLYGTDLRASTVAEFLIQNQECARSLAFSLQETHRHLDHIGKLYGKSANAALMAADIAASLNARSIDEIIIGGLHEYLGSFIRANNAIAHEIGRDFHFAPSQSSSQASAQSSA